MGAAAILRSVHEHAIQPDAVILEGVLDTLLNTVRNRFGAMQIPSFPSAELPVFWGGRQWGSMLLSTTLLSTPRLYTVPPCSRTARMILG